MIQFEIPYPDTQKARNAWNRQYGLNAYYSGKHWRERQQDAQFWHWLTAAAVNKAGIPKRMAEKPVEIRMYWDDGLDIDNHAAMGKMIVDALKGVLIADDDRKHLEGITHRFHDGGCISVEVIEL